MKAEKNAKRLKVLKNVLKKEICLEDYIHCLLNNEIIYKKKQKLFRTKRHDIYTVEQNKVALNAEDNKIFILDDGINTLAWGHYKINMNKENFLNQLRSNKAISRASITMYSLHQNKVHSGFCSQLFELG